MLTWRMNDSCTRMYNVSDEDRIISYGDRLNTLGYTDDCCDGGLVVSNRTHSPVWYGNIGLSVSDVERRVEQITKLINGFNSYSEKKEKPTMYSVPGIKNVIFAEDLKNTYVHWNDGTVTHVAVGEGETYDKCNAFANAVVKKMFGGTASVKKAIAKFDLLENKRLTKAADEAKHKQKVEEQKRKDEKARKKHIKRMAKKMAMEMEAKKIAKEMVKAKESA